MSTHSELPLVSAIMPTRGRTIYAHRAMLMFLDQTYPRKELVIVDDIDDRSFQGRPDFPEVKYHLLETRRTIGEKRNIACEASAGKIILHWDSDDMYAPDRIEHQVDMLTRGDFDIVGYNRMTFLDEETGKRIEYRGTLNYLIGVSMCYWRRVWEERGFAAKNCGEDNDFQFNRALRKSACPAGDRIIALIHGDNSSNKREAIEKNPAQWVAA